MNVNHGCWFSYSTGEQGESELFPGDSSVSDQSVSGIPPAVWGCDLIPPSDRPSVHVPPDIRKQPEGDRTLGSRQNLYAIKKESESRHFNAGVDHEISISLSKCAADLRPCHCQITCNKKYLCIIKKDQDFTQNKIKKIGFVFIVFFCI